jgi:hypothetical protein
MCRLALRRPDAERVGAALARYVAIVPCAAILRAAVFWNSLRGRPHRRTQHALNRRSVLKPRRRLRRVAHSGTRSRRHSGDERCMHVTILYRNLLPERLDLSGSTAAPGTRHLRCRRCAPGHVLAHARIVTAMVEELRGDDAEADEAQEGTASVLQLDHVLSESLRVGCAARIYFWLRWEHRSCLLGGARLACVVCCWIMCTSGEEFRVRSAEETRHKEIVSQAPSRASPVEYQFVTNCSV